MALLSTSILANFNTTAINGEQNNMNGSQCDSDKPHFWHISVLPVYILLVAVLGIVLNVFVLGVFCLHKKSCTVAEIYLSNIAAADLILTSCLPFWAVNAANQFKWPFSHHLCRLVNFSISMNAYSSIYFLVLISIDRRMALADPLSHKGISRPKYAKLGCVLVWGFGLLLSVPTLVFREVKYFPEMQSNICYLVFRNLTERAVFDVMQFTFSFIIPFFIIFYCTIDILQALNNRIFEGLNSQKKEQKATTLVLAVLLAFMICWMPFHVTKILLLLQEAEVLTGCSLEYALNICGHVFMYLAFFNSVLNPILYVIVGQQFRQKVRGLFKQWRSTRRSSVKTSCTNSTRMSSVGPQLSVLKDIS
ncbi:B2 bradykinin receptor-like [Trematomus bernacchii]|uniref:B2 bradykinin receptor-like n=1 Tax=Trematomus bernacchii TaxID=40690 RepID=UPI00146A5CA2|nr:B2 bradykinin receptor-like [Trematomus bernacchii]